MGGADYERLVSSQPLVFFRGETLFKKYLIICSRYGTYSTAEALNAGMDLEMPGPTRWRGQLITHSLMAKKISQYTLDTRVREVLKLVSRVSKTGVPENALEGSRDTPETASLLRKLSGESIVLLKNENGILPLNKSEAVSLKR